MTTEERLARLEQALRQEHRRNRWLLGALTLTVGAAVVCAWMGHDSGSGIACAQAPAAPPASESEQDRAARLKLNTRIPKVDFEKVDFKGTIEWLRLVCNANVQVRWAVLEKAGIKQTTEIKGVHLNNVTGTQALEVLLEDVGGTTPLGWSLSEGVFTISTKEELLGRTITRDIRSNRFIVVDEKGTERASLAVQKDGAFLTLNDDGGKARAVLAVDKNQPVLRLLDAKGTAVKSLP